MQKFFRWAFVIIGWLTVILSFVFNLDAALWIKILNGILLGILIWRLICTMVGIRRAGTRPLLLFSSDRQKDATFEF